MLLVHGVYFQADLKKNISQKYTKRYYLRSECTKGIIRIRKSKDGQQNGHKKRDKITNNDLQNTIYKTKDRVTRTLPLNTGAEYGGILYLTDL